MRILSMTQVNKCVLLVSNNNVSFLFHASYCSIIFIMYVL
jgi:hypothetical protein